MLFVLQRISLTISKIEHQVKLGEKIYQEIKLLDELNIIKTIAKYPQINKIYAPFFSGVLEFIEDLDSLIESPE